MTVAAHVRYDHPIVDRGARRPRERDVATAIRAARERLSRTGFGNPRFERELLIQHATALRAAATVLPVPLLGTAFGLSVFTGMRPALTWILVAAFGCIALLLVTRRLLSHTQEAFDPTIWSRRLLVGHAAIGVGWAYLAGLDCDTCGSLQFDLFQFSILFLAVALTAMVSFTLKAVVPVAFSPVLIVLFGRMAARPEPNLLSMDVVLCGSLGIFALVAERLRRNALERHRNQAEKDELIAELETAHGVSEEARQRAEEANLAKSRFLATMSHELRTPLNAILGFSEVISKEILGPVGNATYKEYVADIHSSGSHLLDLINEILDLSRIEAGRYTLNEDSIELVRVARDCLSYVDVKVKAKSITLDAQFEPALPAVWADERAVRQIVLNLLSNAVKFTPPGGRIVLRVGWTAGGGQYIAVRDNGPGIPADEIPTVLSSFGQGSSAIKSAEQGTGLGLPIVQALVKLHDGEFQLQSKLREGTEVIAILPHARVLEVMPALGPAA
jgi:two-component system, cell cycle sensor histidine kinase PleC